MFKIIFLFTALFAVQTSFAQSGSDLKLVIKDKESGKPLAGAEISVLNTPMTVKSDKDGNAVLTAVPDGKQTINIFAAGYENSVIELDFPLVDTSEREILMEVHHDDDNNVVVISSTRTGREIQNEPTRVEAIDEEELGEKINMRPSNVAMVLHESTGIQVQQTSAVSATQSIKIQGLDGRYTQILKDGFPAYGGFSGSLSILEIPPLDLKQVEIIKGPSATFYGGGAIAGVVNFISKEPEDKPVTNLIFNQTSALGTDFSVFRSDKKGSFGYTVLGSINFQRQYDADDDGFSELPRTRSFSINPRLFYQKDKTRISIGNSFSFNNRLGGFMSAIKNGDSGNQFYTEKNRSVRNVTTFNYERELAEGSRFSLRQSIAFFNREISIPDYTFKGDQLNSYTDATYFKLVKNHALIFGGNLVFDDFKEKNTLPGVLARNERTTMAGGYVQDVFDITEKLSMEAGFRLDYQKNYGAFALPRASLLYKFTDHLSTRIGFGFGYKTPTMFIEDAETMLFRNILPIGSLAKAEKSKGTTFDINYQNRIGEKFTYSINQMVFYTLVSDPIVLMPFGEDNYRLENAVGEMTSRGLETNARIGYGIMKMFLGYTFTDAKADYVTGNGRLALTPRNKVNSTLVFEEHNNFKIGGEGYFTGRQIFTDREITRRGIEFGIFAEKTFGKFSFFINGENITNEKQGRHGQLVFPPFNAPTFADIFMHTEGRIFNGGVKIKL